MSTPIQSHATLTETKRRVNTNISDTTLDTKLQIHLNSADNYTNTQIALHAVIPIVSPDPELVSLTSVLAAAEYNYWTSPQKTDTLKDAITHAESRIQDHIMATFGRKNPTLLAGGTTFATTGKITGRSS